VLALLFGFDLLQAVEFAEQRAPLRLQARRGCPSIRAEAIRCDVVRRSSPADRSPSRPFDLAEVYAAFAASGQLAGYEVTRRFCEIGTPEGLVETDAYLSKGE
jgi:hypothetical protein